MQTFKRSTVTGFLRPLEELHREIRFVRAHGGGDDPAPAARQRLIKASTFRAPIAVSPCQYAALRGQPGGQQQDTYPPSPVAISSSWQRRWCCVQRSGRGWGFMAAAARHRNAG